MKALSQGVMKFLSFQVSASPSRCWGSIYPTALGKNKLNVILSILHLLLLGYR